MRTAYGTTVPSREDRQRRQQPPLTSYVQPIMFTALLVQVPPRHEHEEAYGRHEYGDHRLDQLRQGPVHVLLALSHRQTTHTMVCLLKTE